MKVTRTELTDTCKRVFEGKGFPLGDYEDCAQAIVWLEMHGVSALSEIQQHTSNWDLPKSQAATILFEDDSLAVIDAYQNGGLLYGNLALDLAYLKALQSGFAVVKLQQAYHQQLIIPNLVTCARRGMNVVAYWRDGSREHLATIQAQQEYPHYCAYELAEPSGDSPETQTLSILCTANFTLRQQYIATLPVKAPALCMTPDNFTARYQHHNEAGIDIDEAVWAQLVALSKHVMVEATELSRTRGAGETATII